MAHLRPIKKLPRRPVVLLAALIAACLVIVLVAVMRADGSQLTNRSLKLSDSQAAVTAGYEFSFQPTSLNVIQQVVFQVCANDPFPDTPCVAPVGFDASNAMLVNQTGDVGFSISPDSTSNKIVLSRSPFSSNGQPNSYAFSNIKNPDSRGTYYVRVQTYQDSDLNGIANNYGGIAFSINSSVNINATVPPHLLFCVGVTVLGMNCNNVAGSYVNFGEFSSRQASVGSTQMLAATNALGGYAIRAHGTTLTSGNNPIPGLVGADISRPGVSQFGMNLRANGSPQSGQDVVGAGSGTPTNGYNQINFYRFNSGDVVAASNAPDESRKYTTTYIVNVSKSQSPGVYVSTLTYIALGSF